MDFNYYEQRTEGSKLPPQYTLQTKACQLRITRPLYYNNCNEDLNHINMTKYQT
eukprot:Awhi_evm1s4402